MEYPGLGMLVNVEMEWTECLDLDETRTQTISQGKVASSHYHPPTMEISTAPYQPGYGRKKPLGTTGCGLAEVHLVLGLKWENRGCPILIFSMMEWL